VILLFLSPCDISKPYPPPPPLQENSFSCFIHSLNDSFSLLGSKCMEIG
jgi:hypothetical protein